MTDRSISTDDLLDRVTRSEYGMPVRLMEQVLERGQRAVRPTTAALARWRDDEVRDPLWLVVLLGELRDADAVEALVEQLRRPQMDLFAEASAEALAKIGAPSVPALIELARADDAAVRLWAYAALGWIDDDVARAALLDALPRDPALADVAAMAIGSHARPADVDALHAVYRTCEPWQRAGVAEGIRWAHHGAPAPMWTRDWRLRYRRRPDLEGGVEADWPAIAAAMRDPEAERPTDANAPLLELDALLAPDAPDEDLCEDCGAPIERPMAVPLCPDTAVAVAVGQLAVLESAHEDGIEDVFELLDELEDDEDELRARREPHRGRAREEREEQLWDMAEARATCEWLVEQGVEDVEEGIALIESRVRELAARHGDPDRLLGVPEPVTRGEKIGRNDPCPCGSGRKYKRCCLDKA